MLLTRLLLHALPADSAATDAAALAAAVGDLGALATVMVCATVVLVFLARGGFAYLTAREERLKAQPATARGNTPPAGTPNAGILTALHASEDRVRETLRPLEERIRALEQKESSSSTQLANLRAEIGKDMDAFAKASAMQSEAIQELTNVVTGLRAQLDYATRTGFGNPKTGG